MPHLQRRSPAYINVRNVTIPLKPVFRKAPARTSEGAYTMRGFQKGGRR
jgi:hypothetical protein